MLYLTKRKIQAGKKPMPGKLGKCPTCGGSVSTSVDVHCPHCGETNFQQGKFDRIVIRGGVEVREWGVVDARTNEEQIWTHGSDPEFVNGHPSREVQPSGCVVALLFLGTVCTCLTSLICLACAMLHS